MTFGIPCFGVVDTNTLCNFVTLPLPGNDESLNCLVFYNDSVSNFILFKKFGVITSWFLKLRRFKRLVSFKEWLLLKWKRINFKFKKDVFKFGKFFNLPLFVWFGYYFYFSKNICLDHQSGYFNISYPAKFKMYEGYELESVFYLNLCVLLSC